MADWSSLPRPLLGIIAEKLVAVTDYVRFSAVCVSWLASVVEERHHHRHLRHLPRQLPLLMIPGENEETRSLYNLIDRKFYDFQALVPHKMTCRGSSEGWLLIQDSRLRLYLFNPFARPDNNKIHLPPLTTMVEGHFSHHRDTYIHKYVLSASPSSTHVYSMMIIYGSHQLAFFKSGDTAWTSIEYEFFIHDVIYYKGKFLAVDDEEHVVACDVSTPDPNLELVVVPPKYDNFCSYKYLVETSGDLLLVKKLLELIPSLQSTGNVGKKVAGFKVFKLDLSRRKHVKVKSLGNHVLFLGHHSSVSILASDFFGCKMNSIFFMDEQHTPNGKTGMGVFNLEDGSFEPDYPTDFEKVVPRPIWIMPTLQDCWNTELCRIGNGGT